MIWEHDFARPGPSEADVASASSSPEPRESAIRREDVEAVYLAHFREHCLECAPPHCYESCRLYVARQDRKCARLVRGIQRNPLFRGLLDFGADVEFRRWAQVGTYLKSGAVSPDRLRALDQVHRGAIATANGLAAPLTRIDPRRRVNGALIAGREHLLRRLGSSSGPEDLRFDELVIEAWNPGDQAFRLIVSVGQEFEVFRDALEMAPGHNLHRIPFDRIGVDLSRRLGGLKVFPENDAEVRLIFTWLDFVRYRPGAKPAAASRAAAGAAKPAEKVKCVVWDLDNTLWQGTLIEDGPEGVRLKSESKDLIRALDERGILQTIASKNDHDVAWGLLEKLGLSEYFLSPAIHWGPKSGSLKDIAEQLSINVDTFAFIDDSVFEREEVRSELPQVRIFADTDISSLLDRPEFDVPITETSRMRRRSYLADAERNRVFASSADNYLDFLRGCRLEAEVFSPESAPDRERCFELLQRSNQLNLSTRRYAQAEFDELARSGEVLTVATSCRDRFGEYGTISFATLRIVEGVPLLVDYVQSCRVQRKKLEAAWFAWLGDQLLKRGYGELHARFLPTERNHVLLESLHEVGFQVRREAADHKLLVLGLESPPEDGDIVTIRDAGVDLGAVIEAESEG